MMKIQLKKRLISFAVEIIKISTNLSGTKIGAYLADQVSRASVSAALNYGETISAESDKDFVHKLSIVTKELRETSVGLEIILQSELQKNTKQIKDALRENDELIAIFYKSIKTTKERIQLQINIKQNSSKSGKTKSNEK